MAEVLVRKSHPLKHQVNGHDKFSAFDVTGCFTVTQLQLDVHNIGWVKKLRYVYTVEFLFTIKKNGVMSLTGKWMKLEIKISLRKTNVACFHLFVIPGFLYRYIRSGMYI